MNFKLTNILSVLIIVLSLLSCDSSESISFEILNSIKEGDSFEAIESLPSDYMYVVKFLDSDCSDCISEFEEILNLVKGFDSSNFKLLIIGKGRSEKRLQHTFHQLNRTPDYYSFGDYEINFIEKFQTLKNVALIRPNGHIEFFGNQNELKSFVSISLKK